MFRPVSTKTEFTRHEEEVLELWKQRDIFQKSLDQRRDAPEFVFYDGPPFATGLPHYGHLLAGTIKDIVPRYQTMRGHLVNRRFGWDCHGLPVEYEVEQDLNISGKSDIETMGVDVFNERCRSIVLRYTREWEKVVTRMGRWVDFDNGYKTMDADYMESIWWVFKSLWDKDLIYEGRKILPYCPRCSTPLSNFETNQGYEEVTDPAITVRFKLRDEPNAYVLAWTTTPWTLPSNMALAVGPDITYARVEDGGDVYYMARERMAAYYPPKKEQPAFTEVPASHLVGRRYDPLFPWFAALSEEGAFRVLEADFVSTEDGTGVVHIAPGFGEEDYRIGQLAGVPAPCPIDAEGRFTDEVADYQGREVKEADADIIRRLKDEGKLVHRATITHSYPHCWRCDTPLLYRAISTWFVRVELIKQRLQETNADIHWVPSHLRDGRFGKWLEGARDWAVSRNRYWGTPLPIWSNEDGTERVCVGSREELAALTGIDCSDLHKHFVDELEIPAPSGEGVLRRVPEVLDCWFESGAMPYAQAHYPFENKDHFEAHFPADFIAEGLDQTRGWFYTLMVLAVALFDRAAFRHVVVNGLVLAEDGRKMSKRLQNYPDPSVMLNTYGADAIRLYLIYSPVVRAEDLRFSEDGVKQLMRHIMIPLWNAYAFFVTYANIDGWTPAATEDEEAAPQGELDRWITSSLETLVRRVTVSMDDYDLQGAVRPFVGFIEDLTNWYIRRSRRRFWKSDDDSDKQQAYTTLHRVLLELSKVAAPFVPFISESIFQNLRRDSDPESVHLCDFPQSRDERREPDLEAQMRTIMKIVRLGRQLRTEHDLKVRQPLAALHVVSRDAALLAQVQGLESIVCDELNVRELRCGAHESKLAQLKARPDFKRLGPRLGKEVKAAAAALASLDPEVLEQGVERDTLDIILPSGPVALVAADLVLERVPREGLVVASDGALVVALETALTDELVREGLAREFVNKVQNMRKAAGFDVAQRIRVAYDADEELGAAVQAFADYIHRETLCVASQATADLAADATEWDLNGHTCRITVTPA